MPTQGDKIRILDPAQFTALNNSLKKIGNELEKLNKHLAKEEPDGPSEQG